MSRQISPKLSFDSSSPFCENKIKTTKYELWSFLPVCLLFQLSKTANFYFLIMMTLQCIKVISPLSPITAIAPFSFVMLLSILREATEDWARHKEDWRVNNQRAVVQRRKNGSSSWQEVSWCDVQVGDLLLIYNNDTLPSDVLVLESSREDGLCHIQTASLDGESNLKPREALTEVSEVLEEVFLQLSAEAPRGNLDEFDGRVEYREKEGRTHRRPLSISNFLPRESKLKNCEWVIGVVLYTGIDSKVMLGQKKPPLKLSRIDNFLSKLVIFVLFLQIILCSISAILFSKKLQNNFGGKIDPQFLNFFSLNPEKINSYKEWYLGKNVEISKDDQNIYFIKCGTISFFSFLLLLNTMIPISQLVTAEICKLFQTYVIEYDRKMIFRFVDEKNQKVKLRCKCRTSTLNEDLGAIGFIFSDKTGTLTSNKLEFKCCTIGTQSFGKGRRGEEEEEEEEGDIPDVAVEILKEKMKNESLQNPIDLGPYSLNSQKELIFEFSMFLGVCHEASPEWKLSIDESENLKSQLSASLSFKNSKIIEDQKLKTRKSLENIDHLDFGNLVFSGESPDECCQVGIARCLGVIFTERTKDSVKINVVDEKLFDEIRSFDLEKVKQKSSELEGEEREEFFRKEAEKFNLSFLQFSRSTSQEEWKILRILPFTNSRKRSSVCVIDPRFPNFVKIYCKGADDVILSRLDSSKKNQIFIENLKKKVDLYSRSGLRTLILGVKCFSLKDFSEIHKKIENLECLEEEKEEEEEEKGKGKEKQVKKSEKSGKQQKIDELLDLLESDLVPLGCTATEDKLQEHVPRTISRLRAAGICIWMITGDKLGTAIEIAKSCELLDERLRVQVIDGSKEEEGFEKTAQSISSALRVHEKQEISLVVSGKSLEHIFGDEELKKSFVKLALKSKSVVCCRTTKEQKAEVVGLIKNCDKKDLRNQGLCLAVGDGANDVPMIKKAHIGVGVFGKEGRQAVQNADYAVSQFAHLDRLLLYHGRLSYVRISKLILYFFFKNLAFTIPQWVFGWFSAMSGTSFFDDLLISFFNMIFTALPVFVLGTLEKDVDPDDPLKTLDRSRGCTAKTLHRSYPLLYKIGLENQFFQISFVGLMGLLAIISGVITYLFVLFTLQTGPIGSDGKGGGDQWVISVVTYVSIIIIDTFVIYFVSDSINSPLSITILFSLWMFSTYMMGSNFCKSVKIYGVFGELIQKPLFYFLVFLTITVGLMLPFAICMYLKRFGVDYRFLWLRARGFSKRKRLVKEGGTYHTALEVLQEERKEGGREEEEVESEPLLGMSRGSEESSEEESSEYESSGVEESEGEISESENFGLTLKDSQRSEMRRRSVELMEEVEERRRGEEGGKGKGRGKGKGKEKGGSQRKVVKDFEY